MSTPATFYTDTSVTTAHLANGRTPCRDRRLLTVDGEPSISLLLERVKRGDNQAGEELYARIYDELRLIGARLLRGQPGHSLQATALANEAYLRVSHLEWRDKQHFFALVARAIRSILVDHARKKGRQKRPPDEKRVPLDEILEGYESETEDMIALDEALEKLAGFDPHLARLVELRFFADLPMDHVARALGLSLRTAQREWTTARAWLKKEMT